MWRIRLTGGLLKVSNGFNGINWHFAFPADARAWTSTAGWGVVIGIAYFLTSRLGHSLLVPPLGLAVFWPASGIAVGILMTLGRRALRGLAVGLMVSNIDSHLLR